MTETNGHNVRITNADIYKELRDQGKLLARVEQTVGEVLKPGLDAAQADIRSLKEYKADRTETARLGGAIDSVRVQAYSIGAGVIGGLIALRTLGVI